MGGRVILVQLISGARPVIKTGSFRRAGWTLERSDIVQHLKLFVMASVIVVMSLAMGCSERTGFLPNEDTSLRKPEKQWAADAMKRFPYKADAPKGTTTARAEVDYMYK